MKVKIAEALERWLEEKDNLEKWHDRLSAKEQRILMTQWTGEAWSQCGTDHHFFKRLFEINTLDKNCLVDNRWL